MKPSLSVLYLEDDPDDAELIQALLALEGIVCTVVRVETRGSFEQALRAGGFDLILSDYTLPAFDGLTALSMAREQCPEVPFIFVSGTLGEEAAIEALKLGATDYVLKQRLSRLVPAVRRALQELEERRARKSAEEQLRLSARVFESSSEGIILTDEKTHILTVNPAFTRITGYSVEEVIGQTPSFLRSRRHLPEFFRDMWALLNQTGRWAGEIWNRRKNGEISPQWLTIDAVKNEAGKLTHYIGLFSDISKWKQAESRIHYLAYYDVLTDLPNRALMEDRLKLMLVQAHRAGRAVAVLFIDLDRFKVINDSLGHPIGDQLLQATAERLKQCIREGDTVARLGGDEFTVLLSDLPTEPPATAQGAAAVVAEKIQYTLSQPLTLEGREVLISPSIGVAFYPWDAHNAADLIKQADLAMYQAKGEGGNSYRFYTPQMNEAVQERLAMEGHLRKALEREEFTLHYQPQVDISSGRITGAEALLRWRHPLRGMVLPSTFIPLAEETGQIVPLGEWVLRQACMDYRSWQKALVDLPCIAVNVSPREFRQGGFVERIEEILAETGMEPQRLELELTEGMLMHDTEVVLRTLKTLKELGIRLAIDDFGTGYSSLSYLKHFPIDVLKIDQSFVRNIPTDPNDAAIVTAIIFMAQRLGLEVIAEGVEIEAQLEFLRAHACQEYQGYWFSPPLSWEAIVPLLGNRPGHP